MTIRILFLSLLLTLACKVNAKVCPEGRYFVSAHHRRAYERADGTQVSATQVSSSCRAKSRSYDFWSKRLKGGRPKDWPLSEKSATWSEEERERVLEALSELPEELWDPDIEGIYRLKRSKDYPNPSAYGGHMIVLFDTAFGKERRLARLLAHELAHQKYERIEETPEGTSYRKSTGWHLSSSSDGNRFFWTGRTEGYVEEDGKIAPREDFANNVDHYLFDPDKLKQDTPTAYNWIKTHFSDKFKIVRSSR